MVNHSIGVSTSTWERYRRIREEARDRMDASELTNDEFVRMLTDVYEFHLEAVPDG